MPIEPGQQLLHYRLIEKIGEGGMGAVWKATDTTLDREVAIKFLPDVFADDPERLARFEREAKVLASLNHPNIATVHGLHQAEASTGPVRFLAMELIPGEDLAARLRRGPLTTEAALRTALDVADALDSAHQQGIVHRDLKPANVVLTPDGRTKVLDFGLAKVLEVGAVSGDPSRSPTMTSAGTQLGMILGTASYMSPEQARGKPVDKRADVWAFGCVLYELLSGRLAFSGETVTDTISKVLQVDPGWQGLPHDLPPTLRRLIERCLQKDPRRRMRDIGDARNEIQELLDKGPDAWAAEAAAGAAVGTSAANGLTHARPLRFASPLLIAMALGLLLGAAGAFVWVHRPAGTEAPRQSMRLSIELPPQAPVAVGSFLPALALSPDGSMLAYAGVDPEDRSRRLYVRRMDGDEAVALPETRGAEGPFFSPDGNWIGYYADSKLMKVTVTGGGLPQTICEADDFRGATWTPHGTIVFTPSQAGPLLQVSDQGGEPEPLTELDEAAQEWSHRFPSMLPDGDTVIFSAHVGHFNHDRGKVSAWSLSTGQRTDLTEASPYVRWAPGGHLLYVQASRLLAVPFDPEKLKVLGPAVPIVDGVAVQLNTGAAQFAISDNGTLVYAPGGVMGDDVRFVTTDRQGNRTVRVETQNIYRFPRYAPDRERFAAMAIGRDRGGIWIGSTKDWQFRRLTDESRVPVWTPDGQRIVTYHREGEVNQIVANPVAGGRAEVLLEEEPTVFVNPTSISKDGVMAFDRLGEDRNADCWTAPLSGEGQAKPFLEGPDNERGMRFAPNDRYVAYVSDKSGRYEVYVTTFPDQDGTWQVSRDGGREPVWSADGSELFFRSGSDMMVAGVKLEPSFQAETPEVLFHGAYEGLLGKPGLANFDVSRDGRNFLMIYSPELDEPAGAVRVILGVQEEMLRGAAKD